MIQVATAAMTRSKEIEKSFSHTRPDGRNFGTAITDLGITYRGAGVKYRMGSENTGSGYECMDEQ